MVHFHQPCAVREAQMLRSRRWAMSKTESLRLAAKQLSKSERGRAALANLQRLFIDGKYLSSPDLASPENASTAADLPSPLEVWQAAWFRASRFVGSKGGAGV